MSRGRGAFYLSYSALVLLSVCHPVRAGLWDVDIDLDPAPSPEDGPPFSAHASRDRSLLPYQIVGLIGAYLGFILILGMLALTVGRRLRTRAQNMVEKPVEMIKPIIKTFDPSPMVSPGSQRSWFQSKKSVAGSVKSTGRSPAMGSTGFDEAQHQQEHDKNKQNLTQGLTDIYEQVYRHEEQREQQAVPEQSQGLGGPKSPVVAIYPNDDPRSPTSPTSPVRSGPLSPEFYEHADAQRRTVRSTRGMSVGSSRTAGSSASSAPRKLRKRLADIKIGGRPGSRLGSPKISSPFQRFPDEKYDDEMRTPLSAAFDDRDPGPPPEPPRSGRTVDSRYPPSTPGTADSRIYEEYGEVDSGIVYGPRNPPLPNPQRQEFGYIYDNPAQALTDAASSRRDPTQANLRETRSVASAMGSARDLPLRSFNSKARLESQEPTSPGPASPDLRETVVAFNERRLPRRGLTPGYTPGKTPGTALSLRTPTSAVHPQLFTRAERKQKEKDERAAQGVIYEDDKVPDDKDLWADGY